MKKVVFALLFIVAVSACTNDSIEEEDTLNQIESVDGSKIKRPGSSGGN
ncbi:membrane lipoprotein lipid attachment site-containing protein [Maribacter sp. Hel_I_7]|nr:membrane lipoprotein lipid attachment site-containing protein [Maribacter sp. Hel_I_7]